jgi:hypothetical protein
LFEQCRDIAPDAGEYLCARKSARTAGSFLSEFYHADIPLGEVVGERKPGTDYWLFEEN